MTRHYPHFIRWKKGVPGPDSLALGLFGFAFCGTSICCLSLTFSRSNSVYEGVRELWMLKMSHSVFQTAARLGTSFPQEKYYYDGVRTTSPKSIWVTLQLILRYHGRLRRYALSRHSRGDRSGIFRGGSRATRQCLTPFLNSSHRCDGGLREIITCSGA